MDYIRFHGGFGAVRTSVDVVHAKLTLIAQTRCYSHNVDVVCTDFCTKKEENWQVNFDINTISSGYYT